MILFYQNNRYRIFQFLRLAFLSGLIFIVITLILVSVFAFIYRDNIKQGFINNVNRNIKTEIYIDDISVNVIRNFPHLSLTLKNVKVIETKNVPVRDTLLFAQRIYFQMSIFDLLRKDYNIRRIEISRAKLDLKVFPDKSNNYTFWKTTEGGSDEELSFELRRVVFNQVEFSYTDYSDKHYVGLLLRKAEMQGNFSQDAYLMKLKGDLFLDELIIDDVSMGKGKNLEFNLGIDVENNNIFYFRQGNFNLENNILYAEGLLDFSNESPFLDIKLSGKQLKFENFVNNLPPAYANYFDGYRSKGDFYFDASIKGAFSSLVNPHISASFGIKSGELHHRKTNLRFHNLNFDANFDNGVKRNLSTSKLELHGLNARLNQGTLRLEGNIYNFEKPQLDMVLFSDIEVGDWYRFLQIDTLKSASGKLLVDLAYKGGLGINGRFTANDFLGSNVTGMVKAENVSFTLKNDPLLYHKIMADLHFNNNDVAVNEFSGNASGSDFNLRGYFRNVLPWLFLENEKIFIDADLQSSNINFNELLRHNVNESDTAHKLRLSDRIEFNVKANIGQMAFRKFEASGVKGKLRMRGQVFYADEVVFSSMNGNVVASGYINGNNENKLLIGADANVNGVDVHKLFYQLGNFGQTGIVHENLRGRATAGVTFKSQWSPNLDIDWSSLDITADIKIENGELIDYKPMLALSRFLRVGDLNHVRFSTLENQIRVKDKKIIIPDMEVNSSAINIKLSGEHTFENDIHYRLQVLLSDLLARRNRQNRNPQEQYGDIIDDGLGRTTLFLLVTGNIDDPVFRYDRQGVREKLREDFRRERQTLRDVFRSEFGLQKQETIKPTTPDQPETQHQKQQREIKEREEGRFVIEWDEE